MGLYVTFQSLILILIRYLSVDLTIVTLLFFRNLIAASVVIPLLTKNKLTLFKTQHLGLHGVRALAALIGGYATFYAAATIPLTLVVAITFTAPIFASLFSFMSLNERVTRQKLLSYALGLIGMLVILRPNLENDTIGILAAVLASIMTAIAFVSVKKLSELDPPYTVIAFPFALLFPISAFIAIPDWSWPSLEQLPLILLMGLSLIISQFCMVKAFSYADASRLLPVDFTKLIFTSIAGVFLFEDKIDIWVITGGVIILISAAPLLSSGKTNN